MIHPKTLAGRDRFFHKRRQARIARWWADANGVVHIPLKDGHEALIDETDKDLASQFTWQLNPHPTNTYAAAIVPVLLRARYGKHVSLHRVIMGVPKEVQVDHKNHNGLDCRRTQIRPATRSQNLVNRHVENQTGWRGVSKAGPVLLPGLPRTEKSGFLATAVRRKPQRPCITSPHSKHMANSQF